MASAYDEIKKALALLRRGQPMNEQTRAELNRVRKSLEQQLITAELAQGELPGRIIKPHTRTARDSSARPRQSAEL